MQLYNCLAILLVLRAPHSFASEHNAEDGTVHHLALTLST